MKPPSLLLVFIHMISLFLVDTHLDIHLGINITKLVINFVLCVAIGSALCIFRLSVMNDKSIWPISHFMEYSQSKEDIHMYLLIN